MKLHNRKGTHKLVKTESLPIVAKNGVENGLSDWRI